jgi:hypothetical protein
VWPWAYSIWQIAGFELAHGVFSALCALLVSLPAVYWIWTTYQSRSESTSDLSRSNGSGREGFLVAVFFMVLLSLGVGLCAHVLEDIYIGWF